MLTTGAANRAKSEGMKRYWATIHDLARRQGRTPNEVRKDFIGRVMPSQNAVHFSGKRYHYIGKVKYYNDYVTVVSNKPLSRRQINDRMAESFNNRSSEYGDPQHWDRSDFVIKSASIDETVILRGEKGTYD